MSVDQTGKEEIRQAVREYYASAARAVTTACCPPSDVGTEGPFGAARYGDAEREEVPGAAAAASLGCGNPVAVADLAVGEVVLDLGSGGGLDVLLSARRVGPTGYVYGLDMTDEMLELARENQTKAGVANAEFLRGTIEEIPLPDATVDVVISNCVINLSAEKPRVFAEAHRVLRPGGRFAVTDIVATRHFTAQERADLAAWSGCLAGALTEDEYRSGLRAAGFHDVEIIPTHEIGADILSVIVRATA